SGRAVWPGLAGGATGPMNRPGSASSGGSLTGRAHFLPALVVPGLSDGGVVIECGDAAVPSGVLAQGEVHRLLLAPRARQPHSLGQRVVIEINLGNRHRNSCGRCTSR